MVARAAGGDGYSLTEHLLFLVLDELRVASWQRAGKKNRPKPKRVSPLAKGRGVKHGNVPKDRTPQQVADMLARFAPQRGVSRG